MHRQRLDGILENLRFRICRISPEGCSLILNEETKIVEIEENLGVKLPLEYRDFLKRHGAIQLDNALVVSTMHDEERIGWNESAGLISFYGIYAISPSGQKSFFDLFSVATRYRELLPKGVIPFAEFGNFLFCISCSGEHRGSIYLKAPEQFDDDKPEDFLFLQSPSFLDFLQSLRTMTDEETAEWYRVRGG